MFIDLPLVRYGQTAFFFVVSFKKYIFVKLILKDMRLC